jgi:hypothetical protein
MPIIEHPQTGSPLSQGDILKDINLFLTADGWGEIGGQSEKSPYRLCLVLSRPCVIEHKKSVIVTAIEKLKDNPPRGADTFESVLSFLTRLRDGPESPDVFYLGQLPGMMGRFAARLDLLHTIQLPPSGSERQSFVDVRRIAVLHHDFVRDLHVRLFRAVATLGFDDHGWLSDSDLDWLVESGKADLLKAQSKVQESRIKRSSQPTGSWSAFRYEGLRARRGSRAGAVGVNATIRARAPETSRPEDGCWKMMARSAR